MKEPVYFLKILLKNFRCFGENATLDLSDGNGNWKKWTIILGDNGTGKTSLLSAIALFELGVDPSNRKPPTLFNWGISNIESFFSNKDYNVRDKQIKARLSRTINSSENINYLTINSLNNNKNLSSNAPMFNEDLDLKIFGYGANRIMDNRGGSPIGSFGPNSATLFEDDAKLINAEEWLLNLDYAASKESEIKEFALKKREQVKQVLLDLLPDIEEIRFTTPTKGNLSPAIEFKTDYGYWVNIHQLSFGYKTMVAWSIDLAARLFEQYPEKDNPLEQPAIVLVDEIDLHLHPKWQRKIFDYLSNNFTKTQFIVTAHSPLIVQSAPREANIVLLRKEGDHVIIDNDMKSVRDWRLDQIMSSDLFDAGTRNPEVEKWLTERKLLLQKSNLSSEDAERLKELNQKANQLPTANSPLEIEAMEIIRKAADYLRTQNT